MDCDVFPWCTVGFEIASASKVPYEEMERCRMPGRSYAVTFGLRG